ncbi:hypothetical protein D3C75_787250 [compost metagenome]
MQITVMPIAEQAGECFLVIACDFTNPALRKDAGVIVQFKTDMAGGDIAGELCAKRKVGFKHRIHIGQAKLRQLEQLLSHMEMGVVKDRLE